MRVTCTPEPAKYPDESHPKWLAKKLRRVTWKQGGFERQLLGRDGAAEKFAERFLLLLLYSEDFTANLLSQIPRARAHSVQSERGHCHA
jgi:hypothetical protein